MHVNIRIIIIILLSITLSTISTTKLEQTCFTNSTEICYPCTSTMNCKLIGNEMKVIRSTNRNTTINYGTYVGGHVKIIEEPEVVTFYSCLGMTARGDKTGYLQVNPFTYHPINHELEFRNYPLGRNFLKMSTRFQKCLNSHCLHNNNNNNNNNRLECIILMETRLDFDFDFNSVTTLECVQNITFAHLNAPNVTVLRENHFFRNAYNIIYLELNVGHLGVLECDTFEYLSHVRVIRYSSSSSSDSNGNELNQFACILQHNPSLVRVIVNNNSIWSNCHIFGPIQTYSLTLISFTLFASIALAIFLFRATVRKRHSNIYP